MSHRSYSEAWGPPQFQEKRSRSEKAILGALGEFRGILGAALGIGNSILGIRNSILGMASHDLINTKPTILGATLGAIPANCRESTRNIFICPCILGAFFQELGWSPRTRLIATSNYPNLKLARFDGKDCFCRQFNVLLASGSGLLLSSSL